LSERGGCAQYAYAHNAPADVADPFGLASDSVLTTDNGDTFNGISGDTGKVPLAPEVKQLIEESGQKVGAPVPGGKHKVGDCAEMDALSQLAVDRRKDPDKKVPLTSDEFGEVLQTEVESIKTTDKDGRPQKCCPSCKQTLQQAGIFDAATNG
jgi:hypothetical protein